MFKLLLDALTRGPVSIDRPAPDGDTLEALGTALAEGTRHKLGRSLAIREVDAGSCNGCELEINALSNPIYDLERFGLRFVASPRHADVLLVTGPVSWNMKEALERTYVATPDPKWVVAVGDCAWDCGVFAGSYACAGAVAEFIPVDLHVRGCPPPPTEILRGLLALLEVMSANDRHRSPGRPRHSTPAQDPRSEP
ncbi:MAG: NADH-quinone oxidoreductase subunit B family protein [Gammaproteobacteria bacterium]|nr:NADH-quinone oxidoreductase subunit B family protein [Gammaproteobacteria bacterium]